MGLIKAYKTCRASVRCQKLACMHNVCTFDPNALHALKRTLGKHYQHPFPHQEYLNPTDSRVDLKDNAPVLVKAPLALKM